VAIGLLILRLVVGLSLAAHGAQKLLGWFGGYGLEKTGAFFEQLGFVPGRRNALMAGLSETGGGLLLALGLATPLGALLVFSVMVVAGVSVHLKNGFFLQAQGYEYTLVLGLAGLSVAFTGPGPISMDWLLGFQFEGPSWGLGALLVGLAGAAIQLATRRSPAPAKVG